MTTSTRGSRRTRAAAGLCAAVLTAATSIAAPAATASPLSDLLDVVGSGSAGQPGPETTSPVPAPAIVQFLAEFPANATASFVRTSSSCIELPTDPTRVSTVATSVTLTIGQSRARECQGRSGDATYTVVVTAPTQRWVGGFRLKVNYGDVPATFIGCTTVAPTDGGRPLTCVRTYDYSTLLYLPG